MDWNPFQRFFSFINPISDLHPAATQSPRFAIRREACANLLMPNITTTTPRPSWTNVHYCTIDDDVLRVGVSSDAVGTGNHTTEPTLMALSVPVRFAILILYIPDYSFLRAYTLNLFRLGQLRRSACHTDSTLSIPIYRKINLSPSV